MNLINKIKIRFSANKVGMDEFGNQYYEEKHADSQNKTKKRFVVYNGQVEPSKIPSEWHYWIHYTSDNVPTRIDTHKHSWQKIHLPNLTGTKYAYHPLSDKKTRDKVSCDYEAWKP